MLSYKESLKILKETDALLEGHFILSSGLHSDKYIQCAKLLSKPGKAKELCLSLAEKIKEKYKNIDLILSPAIGVIVIGYEIGRILNIETIFAERVNGSFNLRRGFEIKKGQKMYKGNILNKKKLSAAIKGSDFVYNFAGLADLDEAQKKPTDSIKYNILGIMNILLICKKYKIKNIGMIAKDQPKHAAIK